MLEEIHDFLIWSLGNALIPVMGLAFSKLLAWFPLAWQWVILPMASVTTLRNSEGTISGKFLEQMTLNQPEFRWTTANNQITSLMFSLFTEVQ